MTASADRSSRYHAAQQSDARGWMLLRLDAIGSASATVIDANLPEEVARARLDDLRAAEVLEDANVAEWAPCLPPDDRTARVHAQERIAVESGWVELDDKPDGAR